MSFDIRAYCVGIAAQAPMRSCQRRHGPRFTSSLPLSTSAYSPSSLVNMDFVQNLDPSKLVFVETVSLHLAQCGT